MLLVNSKSVEEFYERKIVNYLKRKYGEVDINKITKKDIVILSAILGLSVLLVKIFYRFIASVFMRLYSIAIIPLIDKALNSCVLSILLLTLPQSLLVYYVESYLADNIAIKVAEKYRFGRNFAFYLLFFRSLWENIIVNSELKFGRGVAKSSEEIVEKILESGKFKSVIQKVVKYISKREKEDLDVNENEILSILKEGLPELAPHVEVDEFVNTIKSKLKELKSIDKVVSRLENKLKNKLQSASDATYNKYVIVPLANFALSRLSDLILTVIVYKLISEKKDKLANLINMVGKVIVKVIEDLNICAANKRLDKKEIFFDIEEVILNGMITGKIKA